jgi:hypothetical protein
MEGSDIKEQEDWIAKYRAALDASKRQPQSQGLSGMVHGVTAHFQTVFRSARGRLGKSTKALAPSLEPSKKEVATSTEQPPIGEGQAKEEVLVEQLAPTDSQCKEAS